jgi:hypothetical protein
VIVRIPSASRLQLAKLCGAPFTSKLDWPKEELGVPARFGNTIHKASELTIKGEAYLLEDLAKKERVESELDRLRMAERDILTYVAADQWNWREAEACFAMNPITGEARQAESRFDKKPGEMMLIADILQERPNGMLSVSDIKTGKLSPLRPGETAQLRALALAAAKIYGAKEVEVVLIYVNQSGVYAPTDVLDELELDFIGVGLRALLKDLPARTEPTGGEHCFGQFCAWRFECAEAPKKGKRKAA